MEDINFLATPFTSNKVIKNSISLTFNLIYDPIFTVETVHIFCCDYFGSILLFYMRFACR